MIQSVVKLAKNDSILMCLIQRNGHIVSEYRGTMTEKNDSD